MRLKLIIAGFLAFIFGVMTVLIWPQRLSPPSVNVVARYMFYACGDCYPQFRIIQVNTAADDENNLRRFLNWEIFVDYQGKELTFPPEVGDCFNAYKFHLTGQFKRRLFRGLLFGDKDFDGTYFDASKVTLIFDEKIGCLSKETEKPITPSKKIIPL